MENFRLYKYVCITHKNLAFMYFPALEVNNIARNVHSFAVACGEFDRLHYSLIPREPHIVIRSSVKSNRFGP